MTKTLQILFIALLSLIALGWLGDILFGVPVKVSDHAVSEGWAEDKTLFETEVIKGRVVTLIYGLPVAILMVITIESIRKRKERLFYWVFLVGLTLIQIVPVAGLVNRSLEAPPFMGNTLIVFFITILFGQLYSAYRLIYTLLSVTNNVGFLANRNAEKLATMIQRNWQQRMQSS